MSRPISCIAFPATVFRPHSSDQAFLQVNHDEGTSVVKLCQRHGFFSLPGKDANSAVCRPCTLPVRSLTGRRRSRALSAREICRSFWSELKVLDRGGNVIATPGAWA
jgi:hypothetical protein